jgi:uncharacterized protein YgiM (DUF1202 family)
MFSFQAQLTTCTLQGAVAGVPVNLHAGPGDEYAVVNTFTQNGELIALAQSDNGWVQGQYSPDGVNVWVGWVRADQVFMSGECADLPIVLASEATAEAPTPESIARDDAPPTDTAPATNLDSPVVVITANVANLRAGPGTSYPIITTARSGERFPVNAQTTTTSGGATSVWYLVQRTSQPAVWVAASVARLTPSGAFVSPALTIPPPSSSSAETVPYARHRIGKLVADRNRPLDHLRRDTHQRRGDIN